jgi:3-isopropylmalate dehydrogenase
MKLSIAVLPGDGIGPEVMHETLAVLRALNLDIETHEGLVGGISMDTHGSALTDETLKMAQDADAVLFGAVGGPANSPWSNPNNKVRPEQAILGLRKGLALFANLRPVKVYDALIDASTLKPEVVRGVDMLILRELTGGCYFGSGRHDVLHRGRSASFDANGLRSGARPPQVCRAG